MTKECLDPEAIAEVMRLPESDPRRAHLSGCPRCRARLLLMERFLDSDSVPDGADLRDARRRLARALEQEIDGRGPSSSRSFTRPWISRLADSLLRPAWKPAVGAIAVAALMLLTLRWTGEPLPWRDHAIDLRDQTTTPANVPFPLAPTRGADGSLTLRWKPCAGADSYEVIVFGTGLKEKARFHAGAGAELRLDPEQVAGLSGAPFYTVAALSNGDEIGRSEPMTLGGH